MTTAALQAEGFLVTPLQYTSDYTHNDTRAPDYAVLDTCDPMLLKRVMGTRPDLALQTTCRALIHGNETGATLCITDPYQTWQERALLAPLSAIVAELNGRLWSAYLRVVLAAVPISSDPAQSNTALV